MTTPNGKTPDIAEDNIAALRQLFPEIICEDKVDFDKLKQLLGEYVDDDKERYNFTWNGKGKALRFSQLPSMGTLRPCKAESKDWDTTGNLYIEGDNLEVLKLLQRSYHNRVKMIYIDPPYNTGEDFIYPDDFTDNIENYLKITGQTDSEGKKLSTNTEASGRYHTDWLNMIYPRLRLARSLLADNGVIFISIDDNEIDNLKKVCNEIFGEGNYIGTIVWSNATDNNPTQIAIEHEYIICYARNKTSTESVWKSKVSVVKDILVNIGNELCKAHEDDAALQEAYSEWFRQNKAQLGPLDRYKYIDRGGVYTGSQSVHNPGREGYRYDVIHPITGKPCKQPLLGYRFPEETMKDLLKDNKVLFGDNEDKIIELKVYASEYEEKLSSVFELDGRVGSYDMKAYFGEIAIFSNPKPVQLLKSLLSFVTSSNDIILDFFSGSATIAQAVIETNVEDNGRRNFICVQMPENLDILYEVTDNQKAKSIIKNSIEFLDSIGKKHFISEIGKERIRRVGQKINNNRAGDSDIANSSTPKSFDVGFRVFKLNSSNLKKWQPDYNNLESSLLDSVNNFVSGRTDLDAVYEIIIKMGLDLSCPLDEKIIGGKKVYSIVFGTLMMCLDNEITVDVANGMVELYKAKKPETWKVVFKDNGFATDSTKANVKEIFKCAGLDEDAFLTI